MNGGGDQSAAEVIWTSARGRYEAGREPVSAIARDLGLTPEALTARARAGGWTLRSAVGRTKYDNANANYSETRGLVGGTVGGCYQFVSEGLLTQVTLNTPMGQQIAVSDQRNFEGWRKV